MNKIRQIIGPKKPGRPPGTTRRSPADADRAERLRRLNWSESQIGRLLNAERAVMRDVNAERKAKKLPPITGAWRHLEDAPREARRLAEEGEERDRARPAAFQRLVARDVAFQRAGVDRDGKRPFGRDRQRGRPRKVVPGIVPAATDTRPKTTARGRTRKKKTPR